MFYYIINIFGDEYYIYFFIFYLINDKNYEIIAKNEMKLECIGKNKNVGIFF